MGSNWLAARQLPLYRHEAGEPGPPSRVSLVEFRPISFVLRSLTNHSENLNSFFLPRPVFSVPSLNHTLSLEIHFRGNTAPGHIWLVDSFIHIIPNSIYSKNPKLSLHFFTISTNQKTFPCYTTHQEIGSLVFYTRGKMAPSQKLRLIPHATFTTSSENLNFSSFF